MAKAKWPKEVQESYDRYRKENIIEDHFGLDMLRMYADAFSTDIACQKDIDARGLTITLPSGRVIANPTTAIQREARTAMRAALKQLHLDLEPKGKVGRPMKKVN